MNDCLVMIMIVNDDDDDDDVHRTMEFGLSNDLDLVMKQLQLPRKTDDAIELQQR